VRGGAEPAGKIVFLVQRWPKVVRVAVAVSENAGGGEEGKYP
jgi:hypothetical protein